MSFAELRCSLAITASQPASGLVRLVGSTQASRVMPLVRCSEAASATVTREVVPLNDRALPNLPAVDQLALVIAPLLPLPERSPSTVPLPWSKLYAATRPVFATGLL